MQLLLGIFMVFALPTQVFAADWIALNGVEIALALNGRGLDYDGANQRFYVSGRTLYNAGEDSWGYWRVNGDAYCSQWPPGQVWDCYRLERSADGLTLRFLDPEGRPFIGKYVE
jgi:hypothetical protein